MITNASIGRTITCGFQTLTIEVAGPDRVPGSDGGDGNRDRRRRKSRHGPGDGSDRSKIDRERGRLQTRRMVAAHPIPGGRDVEVQRTWMMPAEPRVRADQSAFP